MDLALGKFWKHRGLHMMYDDRRFLQTKKMPLITVILIKFNKTIAHGLRLG